MGIKQNYHCATSSKHLELTRKSQLHSIICNNKSVPDYLAINIYYDTLRSWHAPNKMKNVNGEIVYISKLKTKGIYLSYKELAKTHGCSSETIRRKLVKLEKLGLIQRSYKHKETVTTKSYNQLIIYVWKKTPYFYNKHGIGQSEVPALKPQTNHEYITEKYKIDYHSQIQQIKAIANDRGIHKEEDTKELIEPFNRLKDRSRANFVKNSFDSFFTEKNSEFESKNEDDENKKIIKNPQPEQSLEKPKESRVLTTPNTNGFLGSGKYLHEVIDHLTDEMCSIIRTKCGKDFTNRAIREIAKSVSRSKKGAKAFFYHIKGFIAYLAKILTFEKRDPVKISGTNYYITANQTDSEKKMREQEKYLTGIEYSLEVSPEWHLKKRLAAMLERSRAYNILTSWRSLNITKEGVATISLTKPVFLTEIDKKIILSQIKSTQQTLDDKGNIGFIENIEFVYPQAKYQDLSIVNSSNATNDSSLGNRANISNDFSEHLASIQDKESIKELPIWQQVRKYFMEHCLDRNEAIGRDKSWLSKLTPLHESNKPSDNNGENLDDIANIPALTLKPESNFVRDWISSNYLFKLESIAKELGYKLILQDC